MTFNFQWSDSKNGNYAIRKRDTKELKAGQEIERKDKQTTKTHFFILIDEKDENNLYLFFRAIDILKTITYEYVYKGKKRKALNRYLTKKDIEKVFMDIEKYKDKTIIIQITPPKEERSEKRETKKYAYKKINDFLQKKIGKTNLEKVKSLMTERNTKILNIKKLKQEIAKVEKSILKTEQEIYLTLFSKVRKFQKKDELLDMVVKQKDFQSYLNEDLNLLEKVETQKEKANKRQAEYRERKRKNKEPRKK